MSDVEEEELQLQQQQQQLQQQESVRASVYNEDLLQSLQCSVCAHYMCAPIEQCKRGHNICKLCRRRSARCPGCHSRFRGIRNLLAEDMSKKLLFPCTHAHAGCRRLVPSDELEYHEPRCPHRVYSCLIPERSGVACLWEGRRSELEQHVRDRHRRYFSDRETTRWRWAPNLVTKLRDYQMICALGEIFWYCAVQDPDKFRVYWFVQHIGYDSSSVMYEYEFVFQSEVKDRKLSFSCKTLPDYAEVSSIVEAGQCVDMSYQQALSMLDEEGALRFTGTIRRVEGEKRESFEGSAVSLPNGSTGVEKRFFKSLFVSTSNLIRSKS